MQYTPIVTLIVIVLGLGLGLGGLGGDLLCLSLVSNPYLRAERSQIRRT